MIKIKRNQITLFAGDTESRGIAKPFLKWAGGKSQLIPQLEIRFPQELKAGKIRHYYEPFLGGGAVFFYVKQKYGVASASLYDINEEIVLAFKTVQLAVDYLIKELESYQHQYRKLKDGHAKEFYLKVRENYNRDKESFNYLELSPQWIVRTAQMIFLNRTCFNGLFRVNSNGHFNVPFGNYKNPRILDSDNLKLVSETLRDVTIRQSHFAEVKKDIKPHSFTYFDPPYKPLNRTSSFTSYSRFDFNDEAQERLAKLFKELSTKKNVWLMLSNSDQYGGYFDKLYHQEGINITKVEATRMINCNPTKRGPITEIVVTNY